MSSPTPPSPPEHEFSTSDEAVFVDVARGARFTGSVAVALGALLALGGLAGLARPTAMLSARASLAASLAGAFTGVAAAWAGWQLVSASRELHAVAGTRGRDVAHLMRGVRGLRGAFAAVAVMLVVAVVAAALTALSLLPHGG